MQKRRAGSSASTEAVSSTSQQLPMTIQDSTRMSSRVRRNKGLPPGFGGMKLLLIAAIVLLGVVAWSQHQPSLTTQPPAVGRRLPEDDNPQSGALSKERPLPEHSSMPLDDFPSLHYALSHSKIVLLYFAASWCPMSTPVTELIDHKLGSLLMPPPSSEEAESSSVTDRSDVSLVFVSSDKANMPMKRYMKRNWMAVPYDSPDRNNLKRHFKTCAKPELKQLQMTRLREIPTLIVLSGETQQVLTYTGIADLKRHGTGAVGHWLRMLSSAQQASE